ncbi:hypothetical protein ElyMa_006620000 [Elysia marginata]|uniref:Uncharacterized protein n=1 Tax=Elysia marginata TaxID=1093978 RepID=A0AAV4IHA2_9GAST|nr:hypothetical protein ElyMa_006620000 [Elysia marginata]
MLGNGRGVEKSNCHTTVSRVSSFQVDIGQAVFDLMGNLADGRHTPDTVQTKGLDSSVGSGFAPWSRGRGFETQPSTVRAPTGWVGVSIM